MLDMSLSMGRPVQVELNAMLMKLQNRKGCGRNLIQSISPRCGQLNQPTANARIQLQVNP